jgi:hypothetical protein
MKPKKEEEKIYMVVFNENPDTYMENYKDIDIYEVPRPISFGFVKPEIVF